MHVAVQSIVVDAASHKNINPAVSAGAANIGLAATAEQLYGCKRV